MIWPMPVTLSSSLHALLLTEAAAAHPLECCGLVFGQDVGQDFGQDGTIIRIEPTANVAADPARGFEIDPARLIAAEIMTRQGSDLLIGYYHSHPNGRADPSPCDAAASAGDGRLWLIIAGKAVTAWRAVAGGTHLGAFDPVDLSAV